MEVLPTVGVVTFIENRVLLAESRFPIPIALLGELENLVPYVLVTELMFVDIMNLTWPESIHTYFQRLKDLGAKLLEL
jgi:hypothetical protein